MIHPRPPRFRVTLMLLGLALSIAPASGGEPGRTAADILDQSGIRGGLVVHVGCDDGELTAALRATPSFVVVGLARSKEQVEAARRHIRSAGLYGPVSIDRLSGDRLPFVDNLVNLVVADTLDNVPMTEVMRVLAPNGVAMVKSEEGRWKKVVKPRTEEIDDWGHSLHGADNNPVADDLVVGPPKRLQWICGPRWAKHHEKFPPTIPVLVSAAGRVFYFEEATPPCVFNVKTSWSLVARDAFNGTLLWRRAAPDWEPAMWPGDKGGGLSGGPTDYRRRLVAVGDQVFVTLGYNAPVTAIDAATGETIRTYGGTGGPYVEISYVEDSLFVANRADSKAGHRIARIDPNTGERLWEAAGGHGMAIDDGRALFIEGDEIGALDAVAGNLLWKAKPLAGLSPQMSEGRRGKPARLNLQGPLRTGEGIVLACPGARGAVVAVSVADGHTLWSFQNQGFRPFFRPVTAWIVDHLVWVTEEGTASGDIDDDYYAFGLDPKSGEVRRKVPCGAVWNCGHHQRCYPSKATSRYLIFSRRGAEFLDLEDGKVGLNNWTRGACGYGVMPANGLLYSPPHACRCYSEVALRGLTALAPAERGPQWEAVDPPESRLEKGSAYKAPISNVSVSDSQDWPAFRHDAQRSGTTKASVRAEVKRKWQVDFGGPISQATVARGQVFLAASDSHTVHSLDLDTGESVWTFTTGGRIDTPPTIVAGRAFFGSADGWAYCVRADDGKLIWRFRAAPHDLRMGSMGQIESVWPVHGSVLVRNGVAYFAAGRGSFVDGGIWVYGLDMVTGSKLYEHHLEGPDTGAGFTRENPGRGFVMPGSLPDVLVADDARVYMRHLAFDPELKQATNMDPNFYEAPVRAGEEFGGDHKYWCDLLEIGPRAFVGRPEWDFRSYFNQFPGQRLYSTSGLLDDSWHIRSYWAYGQIVGQYVVFDGARGYAVQAYPNAARWASYQAGDGYLLYAGNTAAGPRNDEPLYALKAKDRLWQVTLPFRPVAMVCAGEYLFLAGPPDSADPVEALAALQGERGAALRVVSTADGKTVAEHRLDSVPAFDGMSAAARRLLISTRAGELICFE